MKRPKIPAFSTKAAEARWWYEHRNELDKGLEQAAKTGALKKMTRTELARRVSASRVVSIRLPEADLAKARRQAARKGLPYQPYMKSLLHEALEKADKRRAR